MDDGCDPKDPATQAFAEFRASREPRHLAAVFDRTAPELARVAAYLAGGDPDRAQDALQATFLTAIEDAGAWDAQRPVLPWLLGILANHVRKERRRGERARGVEIDATALAGEWPATVDAVAAREFAAEVAAAMGRLPSPFREVVVLHVQHALSAKEIGAALGRPAGTVRTQLVRGLDRLRRLLPTSHGAASALVVLSSERILAVRSQVIARLRAVRGPASWQLGHWHRRFIMVSAGLVVGIVAWAVASFGGDASPAVGSPDDAARSVTEVVRRAPDAARRTVPLGDEAAGGAQVVTAIELPVRVLVRGPTGQPAPGVAVVMVADGPAQELRSDANGRIALKLQWPGTYQFAVVGSPATQSVFWPEFAAPPRDGTEVILDVPRGATWRIRVVDARGEPVPDAIVETNGGAQLRAMFATLGRTDGHGELVAVDQAPRAQLRAWAHRHAPSVLTELDVGVGDARDVVITLPGEGRAVRGIVRNASGAPVAHAALAIVQFGARFPLEPQFFTSDGDGRFVADWLLPGHHALVGRATEDGVLRRGLLRFELGDGTQPELELTLTRGAEVRGRFVDAQGGAVSLANVVARDRPDAVHALPYLETWSRTDATGAFTLRGLVPGRYRLEAGHADTTTDVELVEGQVLQWDPVAPELVPLAVRVTDAAGRALGGWQALVCNEWGFPAGSMLTSDVDGRLLAADRELLVARGVRRSLAVYAPRAGGAAQSEFPALVTPPLEFEGRDQELRVPDAATRTGAIRGRLVRRDGVGVTGARVRITTPRSSGVERAFAADPLSGEFVAEGLPPGRYDVRVALDHEVDRSLPQQAVLADQVTDLGDLVVDALGQVRVHVDDAPPTLSLQLIEVGGGQRHRLRPDGAGDWRSDRLHHGRYRVIGRAPSAFVTPQDFELAQDEVAVTVTCVRRAASTVTFVLGADARSQSVFQGTLTVARAGRVEMVLPVERGFRGVFDPEPAFELPLPSGELELQFTTWDRRSATARATVEPDGGARIRIDLR